MAKQTGLGDNAFLGGYNLSGVVTALGTISGGPAALDVTTIDQLGYGRIGGLRTGEISFTSLLDDGGASNRAGAAGSSFVGMSSLPAADTQVMYLRGTTLGNPVACMVCKQVNFDANRGTDGMLSFTVQCLSNGYGLEWGRTLTAGLRTDTAATNGASVDDGASSSFGLQAYLQVGAFTGTNATVKLQESSDNGSGDAFADVVGGGFTQITAGFQTQRIATATNLTVERYLRAVTTTAGGFSSMAFVVGYTRNAAAPVF